MVLLVKHAEIENTMTGIFKAMKDNSILASLLPDLATLPRIYLTFPSTSCEAERSFSVLRRLKNYMRTPISNHVTILTVYKSLIDTIDTNSLLDEFILRNVQRQGKFALKKDLIQQTIQNVEFFHLSIAVSSIKQ